MPPDISLSVSSSLLLYGTPVITINEARLWLEQKGPGSFERHALELNACDHATLSLGDYDKDGDLDFAVGVFNWPGTPKPRPEWVFLYENLLH